ncbi:MAG: radical SAM protein [Elusimicrobia bacterium]|nr:radical SAM protein [Elusimicrobiota bacterium]
MKKNPAPNKPFSPDKIFAHSRRIENWLENGHSKPVTFELDITNICNNQCPGCFGFYNGLNSEIMRFHEIETVLRQVAAFGGKAVTFTGGGEPLTHPHFIEALQLAKSLGLDTALISNGLALTPNIADAVLKNCTWTRISLDAAEPESYRRTHGMGWQAYAKVLDNIGMLTERKQKLNSRCTVGVGFLTHAGADHNIHSFAELCKKLGVDYAQYRPLLRRHGEKSADYSSKAVLSDMQRAKKDFSNGHFKVLCSEHKYAKISAGQTARPYKKCYGHNFAAVICADMKMYLCCHMRGVEKYCLGDLRKDRLADVWKSAQRKKAFENINFRDCPPLCRCDSFNTILWEIKEGRLPRKDWPKGLVWEHENFI